MSSDAGREGKRWRTAKMLGGRGKREGQLECHLILGGRGRGEGQLGCYLMLAGRGRGGGQLGCHPIHCLLDC